MSLNAKTKETLLALKDAQMSDEFTEMLGKVNNSEVSDILQKRLKEREAKKAEEVAEHILKVMEEVATIKKLMVDAIRRSRKRIEDYKKELGEIDKSMEEAIATNDFEPLFKILAKY